MQAGRLTPIASHPKGMDCEQSWLSGIGIHQGSRNTTDFSKNRQRIIINNPLLWEWNTLRKNCCSALGLFIFWIMYRIHTSRSIRSYYQGYSRSNDRGIGETPWNCILSGIFTHPCTKRKLYMRQWFAPWDLIRPVENVIFTDCLELMYII